MKHREMKHGIALPDSPAFHAQVAKLSAWVVAAVGIHWIFVAKDGSIRIVAPGTETGGG